MKSFLTPKIILGIALGSLILASSVLLALQKPSTNAAANDTFRVNEYYLAPGTFTGTNHTLTLNQNLASDYFVIVQGSDGDGSSGNDRGPDENYAALISDPFGTGDLFTTGAANEIEIARNNAVNSWVGVITVVECTADCSGSGFELLDVERVVHSGSNTNGSDTSGTDWTDINQVMLMGGFNGSGCTTAQTSTANTKSCHTSIFPSGNNTIEWSRNSVGATLTAATSTVMVLEWGSEWTVQRVNPTGNAGGNGANATNEYVTATINSVVRDNTWVWGTGHTSDQGIGDASEGTLITLGDGVNQNANETEVAIGQEYNDIKNYEVYTLTHPDLNVDYRFKTDGNSGDIVLDVTVDDATDSTARMALVTNGCNGTGNAYPRPMFSARYTANNTVRLERRRSGQNFPAWVQGIDFSDIVPGVDLSTSSKIEDDADNVVIPQQTIGYTLTIANTGTINATGVDVDDTLDTDLENLSVTSIVDCGGGFTDNSTSTVLDIDDVDINVGTDCVISFSADLKAGLLGGTVIQNTATLGPADQGSSIVNLQSSDLTLVANTDLAVQTSVDNGNPEKTDSIVYTILISNNGPADATDISLFNSLPSGVTFNSAVASQGSFSDVTGLWTVGSITNGNNATLDITVDIDDDVGANISNNATLTLSTPNDYILSNNSDNIAVAVQGGGSSGGSGGGRRITIITGDICGDGLQHTGEECDDGNNDDEDGCSATCLLEDMSEQAVLETSTEVQQLSVCPTIPHPQVCANMISIFGDIFGHVRMRALGDGLHGAAESSESCLNFDPERSLNFYDLDPLDEATPIINLLKNTRISSSGDYIFSGQGNHSSGKDEEGLALENWAFGTDDPVSRVAAVKTILISNCIPIEEIIPIPENRFSFTDISTRPDPQDPEKTFLAQIFYTAYKHGIVKGYQDGSARPYQHVSNAELISMLLRAAESNPDAGEPEGDLWFQNNYDFARSNGFYNGLNIDPEAIVNRRDFARLLARSMAFSKNPQIHSYIQRVNPLENTYFEELPTFAPTPVQR